ncbi:MAG: Helix-turn-helix domain [Nocardioidaceae bacterium]|nr:Helix-turn-helix domain [Nocardioidaceae bacterium]
MARVGRPRAATEANVQSWTIKETAALLRISTRTVERLVGAGALESYRVGRAVRIWARSVLAYQEGHRLEPTPAD